MMQKEATGVHTYNLSPRRNFTALKAKVDKTDIAKLINVWRDLNTLKTKIEDLDIDNLKTVSVNLK